MELKILEGDYGLPSFDYKCTQLLLCAKVTKQHLYLNKSSWNYPQLKKAGRSINEFDKMFKVLCSDVDKHLNKKDANDKCLLLSIINQSILPALLFLYWIDRQNYEKVTCKWFAHSRGAVYIYLYMDTYRKAALNILKNQYSIEDLFDIKSTLLLEFAKACRYCATQLQLNQTRFLFGNTPTSVDIILYSYLAPIINVPFPNNSFAHILRQRQYHLRILVKYIHIINSTYFPEIRHGERYLHILHRQRSSRRSNKCFAFFILFMTLAITMYGIRYDFFNEYFVSTFDTDYTGVI